MNHETNESMGNLSVDDLPVDIPAPEPLPVAEQLAHTQTAYQALLEDFNRESHDLKRVRQELADVKNEATIEIKRLSSIIVELREQVDNNPTAAEDLNKVMQQVADLEDNKLTLHEAVRLKAGEVEKLEEVVKLKQQVIDRELKPELERARQQASEYSDQLNKVKGAYEKLESDALKAASPRTIDLSSDVLTLRDEVKSLRRQVDDMQEANRIMRRRLQS